MNFKLIAVAALVITITGCDSSSDYKFEIDGVKAPASIAQIESAYNKAKRHGKMAGAEGTMLLAPHFYDVERFEKARSAQGMNQNAVSAILSEQILGLISSETARSELPPLLQEKITQSLGYAIANPINTNLWFFNADGLIGDNISEEEIAHYFVVPNFDLKISCHSENKELVGHSDYDVEMKRCAQEKILYRIRNQMDKSTESLSILFGESDPSPLIHTLKMEELKIMGKNGLNNYSYLSSLGVLKAIDFSSSIPEKTKENGSDFNPEFNDESRHDMSFLAKDIVKAIDKTTSEKESVQFGVSNYYTNRREMSFIPVWLWDAHNSHMNKDAITYRSMVFDKLLHPDHFKKMEYKDHRLLTRVEYLVTSTAKKAGEALINADYIPVALER